MNANTYILDHELIKAVSQQIPETLLTIIIKCILVVRQETGVSYTKMLDRRATANDIADARHMAAALMYEETFRTGLTQRVIAELLGTEHGGIVRRAQQKEKCDALFAKRMQSARARYEKIVLAEYDKEIPF